MEKSRSEEPVAIQMSETDVAVLLNVWFVHAKKFSKSMNLNEFEM